MSAEKKSSAVDWIALWVLVMGVWPFADPGHGGDSFLSVLDLVIHGVAAGVLLSRWTIARRSA